MLRQYQIDIAFNACQLLIRHKIAYLSMQVRTGKTLTSLATADIYGAKNVLFLTKKKAITSIAKDYELLHPAFSINILNYEQLKNHTGQPDLVILDEAHCLGQFPVPAKKIAILKKICHGLPIIYLSGTPTPESYSQIFHQLHISSFSPFHDYPNFYKWAKDFVKVRIKYLYNRAMNDYSFAYQDKIKQKSAHLFISLTQEDAGFTEHVQEQVLKVEMKRETYNLANKLKKERVHRLYNYDAILADTEVKLMQKLHQIYSGTCISENGVGFAFDDYKAAFIKAKFKGKKIAIFYKYKAELQLLKSTFTNLTESPDEFNLREDKIFVSQIQSGREGINLSTADCLIMFNIDFSSVSYQQARARIQTKDRTTPARLYWVFADGGIEEKIYQRVINKQDYTLSYFKKDYLKTH